MVIQKIKQYIPKNRPTKAKHIVALDIGTEYVKALIGKINGDEIEIIGVGRAKQQLADMQSGAIADISGVVDNCEEALNKAERMAGVDAEDVIIGIAGELVKGTTSTIRFKRANPKNEISVEEMDLIIKRVQERARQNAQDSLAMELGNTDVDVRMVNSALVAIEIDGYRVSNPIGFQGRDVAIQLYTAFAPMIHIGALERTAQMLSLDLVAVAAEPFAVARSVIGADASSTLSAILIDVGGGTTDIAVVNEGGVEGTKMFGIGGRAFTRSISSEFGVEFNIAEEVKLALGSGKLTDAKETKVKGALQKTLNVWQSGIELGLGEFNSLDHLPNSILLCGGGASLEMLLEQLEDSSWYKQLPFTKKPSVTYIQPSQVPGIVDKTGVINNHTYITAMGLLRVGLDTLSGIDETSDSIRDRLNKILQI
jgi:cell division protein FtsA